ncbi:galactosylgalactosylxylosylprotein 3-beta-glucuronosyltransferase 3 [Biomphalaria glabrata]|uniref:Galactosylgalactosylxylosylprotein 3-beta-glucuronosyltransferase n=1 Tax=Biomphalaria glabrata TaxID=6526 RepID=A0A9W2ZTB4_BIOGL|nr:galactosylgalactosylxylosylprotein 3-beta-glucuronosyltransferase 3-like [Biomphalaria glabrata]XP_055878245.1 galactosylgalactosylxylosylprotein 3-beta-glucuronosyltransferase 3-like [Biomphalaria glabrata]XP_055878246.1 galactosylgalactosylxylosylprotein 3-beta-glucuronosyltransferase 3-like [Biomphalaria glabrata]XP_055878247.1 galactosylgalactosylxylosylprotein 3-beta-glucuronosyltransferase 3-like [Biomphalaria glabrata]
MKINRMFSARKFLCIFIVIFTFLFAILVSDLWHECDKEELIATKNLLKKYASQIQELRNELKKNEFQQPSFYLRRSRPSTWLKSLPVIYLITPTHARLEQKAELTRLSHTLLHVPNIHWIIIEDSSEKTALVQNFLNRTNLSFTHLYVPTPPEYKMSQEDPNWLKPRGVLQRNAGLDWLRNNTSPSHAGVVYFADDDNTYSLKIFEEMRYTKKVSVWPVGLVGYLRYERPIVNNGKVTAWYTYWKPNRPFAMDMAGFAINLKLVHKYPEAKFSNAVQRGFQESTMLTKMQLTLDDLEPKANMCTEVLVWHTRTEKSRTKNEEKMVKLYGTGSDPNIEV